MTFGSVVIVSVSPRLQLYGEYREQLGNFARREAARLLTERQWRRQAGDTTTAARRGHGRRHHHHHHHPMTLESHHSHVSSTKKPRPYSKCQGDTFTERHTQSCALGRCKLEWHLMWWLGNKQLTFTVITYDCEAGKVSSPHFLQTPEYLMVSITVYLQHNELVNMRCTATCEFKLLHFPRGRWTRPRLDLEHPKSELNYRSAVNIFCQSSLPTLELKHSENTTHYPACPAAPEQWSIT